MGASVPKVAADGDGGEVYVAAAAAGVAVVVAVADGVFRWPPLRLLRIVSDIALPVEEFVVAVFLQLAF